jgi:hypothetical protein
MIKKIAFIGHRVADMGRGSSLPVITILGTLLSS